MTRHHLPTRVSDRLTRPAPAGLSTAVLCAVVIGALAAPARACPFCDPSARTAGPLQSLEVADATVRAKVVGRRIVPAGDAASTKTITTFEILSPVAGDLVAKGARIELTNPRGAIGDARNVVLMLGTDRGRVVLIDAYPDETGRLAEHLAAARNLPKGDHAAKLAYYVGRLQDSVPEIADDAMRQFMDIPWRTVRDRRETLPKDKLRAWLADPEVAARKKGLYGLLLGTAGAAEDEAVLRRAIPTVQDNAVAAGGVLAGLCVVTGKAEAVLGEALAAPKAPAAYRQAVVQVVRFLYDAADGEPDLKADAMKLFRLALTDRDAAPVAIQELTVIGETSLTDEIKKYWKDPARLTPAGRLAVFRYRQGLPREERDAFAKFLVENPVKLDGKEPGSHAEPPP